MWVCVCVCVFVCVYVYVAVTQEPTRPGVFESGPDCDPVLESEIILKQGKRPEVRLAPKEQGSPVFRRGGGCEDGGRLDACQRTDLGEGEAAVAAL